MGAQRGSSTLQLVLVMPAMILVTSVIFDAVGYYHARQAATIAARQGADAARIAGAAPVDGTARAATVLAQLGNPLNDPRIHSTADARSVVVRVDGTAPELVPGLALRVHAVALAATETFRPYGSTP